MRARHVVLSFACVLLLALVVLLRHHLRDLAEVARTYATFYPYVDRHPRTLYRYPRPSSNEDDSIQVPPIIHQIFLTEGRPASLTKYEAAISSCHALHPNWMHDIWTDENATAFIEQHYHNVLPHYQGYRQSIQRANILRYALLDHFGGVYLDLDVTCLQPLDELRYLPWVTPGAYPAGVNNAFILTRPHHPFLKHLLDGVKSRNLFWGMPYIENMLSTGCMFFSNRWMSYARSLARKASVVEDEDRLYIIADTTGDMDPHMLRGAVTTPLFRHGGASSWHGWDAAAIVMIGAHYDYFLAMMGLGAVFAAGMIWRMSRRRGLVALQFGAVRRSMDKGEDSEALVGVKEG